MTEAVLPAVTEGGVPSTVSVAAVAGSTVTVELVPVRLPWVAVTVCGPAVVRVTGKVWLPVSAPVKV